VRAARAAQLFFHTRPIKFLIYGVVLAVPVVDAKTPYFNSTTVLRTLTLTNKLKAVKSFGKDFNPCQFTLA